MNKTELTAAVAQKAGLSKSDAAKVLGAFFETVSEELSKGQAVQIIGFGNFEVADYKARTGRNTQTDIRIVLEENVQSIDDPVYT